MAEGYEIAEGYIDVRAETDAARRAIRDYLRFVDQQLDRAEEQFAASGRRAGQRFRSGLTDSLPPNGLIDEILPGGGGGGGGGGGAGGGGGGGIISTILGALHGGISRIIQEIRDLVSEIQSILASLQSGLGDLISDIQSSVSGLLSDIRSGFIHTITYLQGAWVRFIGAITSHSGSIRTFLSTMWTRIRGLWTSFTTWANSAFTAAWTRIRSMWSSMGTGARTVWVRFTAWAGAAFAGIRILASRFWSSFRTWALTTFTTLALVAGILFSRMRGWASGVWSRFRSWGFAVWSGIAARGRSMWTRFAAWARSAWTAISGWFTSLFSTVSTWLSGLGGQLSSIMSSLTGALGPIGSALGPILQIAMYGSLIPIVLALGGAIANLLPLLFLLPAAIMTLVAVIAPAILAFKGLGDAIGAGMSGDMEKFNEALKKLTPNAQKFVKEFVALGPALRNIKRWSQNAFFLPLLGTIKPLATTLLPALEQGLAKSASGLGRLVAGFAKMLATPEVISAINTLFATTERILDRLGPPLASLFGAFFGTVEGGLPWIERFVDTLANGIERFANWLREVKANGQMQAWLQTAWTTAKNLWEVIKQLGAVIGALFQDTGDEGDDFLVGLADSLKELARWLNTTDGKESLDDLVDTIYAVMAVIDLAVLTVKAFGIAWLATKVGFLTAWQMLKDGWHWLEDAFNNLVKWVETASSISWEWIKDAASAVGDFFIGVGKWFVDAYDTVVGWGGKIVDWFAQVPGWIGEFFSNLPGWFAAAMQWLWETIFYYIGFFAGSILKIILGIPVALVMAWDWIKRTTIDGATALWEEMQTWDDKALAALSSFWTATVNFFDSVWDACYEGVVGFFIDTWNEIKTWPGRAGEALSAMPGQVGKWFTDTWNQGKKKTDEGIADVISKITGLKDKTINALSGASSWLWEAGKDVMRGLMNGVQDALGWAVDAAKRAAKKVAEGFMDGLDIGSPSRVMRVEVGRWMLPGLMQGVDDTLPDTMRYMGATANMLVSGFSPTVNVAAPSVDMGSTVLHADFGNGIAQAVPLLITRNPRIVAAAAAVGKRERNGWVNTNRGTVG